MRLFEYPYIIITILFFCFLVLGIVGIYFARQGLRATKGTKQIDFSTVSKLELLFHRLGKQKKNRCVIYISVSLENARNLYSEDEAGRIYNRLKPIFLKLFADGHNGLIARYDGRNFIALEECESKRLKTKLEQCIASVNQQLTELGVLNIAQLQFGYYCGGAGSVSFSDAINRAKQACTVAEQENLPYAEWTSSGGKALEQKIKIENKIETEIDNNRFFLEYQPVVDAETKKIVGAEVLSRLYSEEEGVLTPKSFLSAVNSVGVQNKFDYYIFEKNCKWISNQKSRRERYVYTINFSRTTLCEADFADNIIRIVEKYGLSYASLAVEILEDSSVVGVAREQMIQNLLRLKEKGILILLDDFGSGYTTFGDLQNLHIDTVKIDKSITANAHTETGFLILKNIVRTAHDLGMKTVCEGIETPEQEKIATEAGCDMLQGYYYSRPIPVTKLEELLKQQENEE